jgi:lipopolysaccharide export LptBFGC system permease protein LptF
MKPSATVAVIFLLLVSISHLLRLLFQGKVTADAFEILMWMSVPAFIGTAAPAIWLLKENKK